MQRRITIALLATAMAAIVLVGLGVLGFANIGAERDARDRVAAQLDAVVELAGRSPDGGVGPALGRLGDSLDNSRIEIGRVTAAGELRTLRRAQGASGDLGPSLTDEERAVLDTGEPVFTTADGRVRGVTILDVDTQLPAGGAVVAVVDREIATISRQARIWFVLSALIVLAGAAVAASVLARRFVRPIRRATAATGAIANGDLTVRVPVEGEDELADLGAGVNRMAAELERGRAAEQQFLLSVSHDLRTPLTALRGFGEALEDGTVSDPQRAGAVISHNANRLSRLVGDLLDLGKLQADQFRFDIHPFDLSEVVLATTGGLAPAAADRSVQLSCDAATPLLVSADPDRTGQIVANLVENAAAFARSAVTVSVGTNAGFAMITVTDDGPGISADDLPHVFERLYVTKLVPERKESSSGLGLAIVRELTTAMGGRVDARSVEGEGTSMIVQLPLAEPEVPAG